MTEEERLDDEVRVELQEKFKKIHEKHRAKGNIVIEGEGVSALKRAVAKSYIRYKKPPYLSDVQIHDKIRQATLEGKTSVSLPKKQVRFKELEFYLSDEWRIKDGKQTGICLPWMPCGAKNIRILWR